MRTIIKNNTLILLDLQMEDSGTYVCYGTMDENGQTFQAVFDVIVAGMYMYNI